MKLVYERRAEGPQPVVYATSSIEQRNLSLGEVARRYEMPDAQLHENWPAERFATVALPDHAPGAQQLMCTLFRTDGSPRWSIAAIEPFRVEELPVQQDAHGNQGR